MHLLNLLPQRLDSGATPTFAGLLAGDGTAAAPSISFAADSDTGFYRAGSGQTSYSANGTQSLTFTSGGVMFGISGSYIQLFNTGAAALVAAGTNQNITLTPSGSGVVSSSSANFDITSSLFCSEVYSTAAWALGRGGSIGLGGFFDGSTSATFAGIAGVKESAVSGQTGGMLTFHSRASGASMTERARILSTGRFLLGTTTDSGALLQIGTDLTTAANGMVFGTDTRLYRHATKSLSLVATGTDTTSFLVADDSYGITLKSRSLISNGALTLGSASLTALTLSSTQAATFASSVTGLRFIASTSLIAGDFTSTNDVGIVAKSTTAVYNPEIAAFLAPSQLTFGVGAYSNVYCGVAQSAYNSGSIVFAYAGAGSVSNAFGLGMYGQLPTILINGSKQTTFAGLIFPQQAVTASAPTYVKGAIYFDTTLNKLRVGGATAWETITSV